MGRPLRHNFDRSIRKCIICIVVLYKTISQTSKVKMDSTLVTRKIGMDAQNDPANVPILKMLL